MKVLEAVLFLGLGATKAAAHQFAPLSCNNDIDSAACINFSSQGYNMNQTVEVPCGTCISMDLVGDQAFQQGLDVQGKLVFPSTRTNLKIITPYLFVQGEMIVEELHDYEIPQPTKQLEFHFVGTDDVTFISHPDQIFNKCANGCNLSKKAFVVAGGKLDIQGMHDNCNTWTRVQATEDVGSATFTPLAAPTARNGCSRTLVSESFDGTLANQWDGIGAGSAVVENGYYSVSSRTSGTQGPRVWIPVDCITPNQPYVLKFRYRYRHSSTTESEFIMPYLKMVRYKVGGGNDWISADEIYPRGQTAKVPADEWHQLESVIQFDDIMADSMQTSDLTLYVSPFDDADIIDIDDFVLELAPAAAFDSRTCDNLLVNGDTDIGLPFAYPFYPTGGAINVMSDSDNPDKNGSPYIRNTLRSSIYSSPFSQNIPSECLVKASIYEFSAYFRVHSNEERQVSVSLIVDGTGHTIANCPSSPTGDWVNCSSRIQLNDEHEGATIATFSARVTDDDTSVVDMANAKLEYKGGRANKIVPEEMTGISDCWAPGAEILVTSHTIQHTDSQVATIASIDDATGDITLTNPIHKPISIQDDPNTAVEVALLSRNIKFTAAEDDAVNPLHGGHFIIMGTPAPTIQKVIGIESHGFGQQGKLGRYPFHFHMCGSVAGSVLSKNAIRNTKQRGIVVHGTNDLYLEGNILHNTRGHAVMLEDGAEQGNTFLRNLGAVGHGVENRISEDESDPTPSTFWITNPQNTFIGNVAAGSQFSGFWFEVKTRVRGPSANTHGTMVPNKLDLKKFIDNVSHSNAQGLQTYPQSGYRPDNLAVFENHKSYRNRVSGIFFHAGGRLSIDGGYISDNRIGIDIDMDHSDVISNTVIVGSSTAYQKVVNNMGYKGRQWPEADLCSKPLVGIRLDSYHSGSLFGATGSYLVNSTFSGFGSGSCDGSSVIHVDKEDTRYFDTRNRVKNTQILDDSNPINLCDGEEQIAIRLMDDTFIGEGPGYLISDTLAMNAHPDCDSMVGTCAAVCPGVCLRSMTIMIPSSYERGSLTLHVNGTLSDGRAINQIEIQDFQCKEEKNPGNEASNGRFFVTLPAGGSYEAYFADSTGQKVWPLYTDLLYEDVDGNCGPDFESFNIEALETDQCDQLVQNGDFESGTSDNWRYAGNYGLEVVNGGSDGSSYSLKTPNANGGSYVGPGQYIDTRCIEEGYVYSISAKVKMTDSTTGLKVGCNINAYSGNDDSCPTASFRFTNRLEESDHDWKIFGKLETTDEDWNVLSGSYIASEFAGSANQVYMHITGVRAGIDIQVDNVQLARSEVTQPPTLSPTPPPTKSPTPSPTPPTTSSPTPPTTKSPTPQPSTGASALVGPLFEGSNSNSITFASDGSILLETSSTETSTILSSQAQEGVGADSDLELVVQIPDRDIGSSGWQPSIVLFFAPGQTPIEDVTTPDNAFVNFEGSVAAMMQQRILPGSGTYFSSKAKQEDGTFVTGTVHNSEFPIQNVALKLTRSAGMVRSYYSFDAGTTWTQIGTEYLLAETYRTVPLKVGYRMYLEYKAEYRLVTSPSIVSNGEIEITLPPKPTSYFDGSNADLDSATCTGAEGCHITGTTNVAKVLNHETFDNDIVFISEFTNRPMFGGGYQSGLWLFLAPADATLSSISDNDGSFRDYVVGTVGDKIYAPSDYTYIYSSSIMDGGTSSSSVDQYKGQSWKNIDGYYKLQRINGVIESFVSPNGHTWTQIGNPITLPSNLATSPVKIGYRVQKNWAPGYEFQVLTTVEHGLSIC